MANKSTTIKTATDKELDELLVRLRKENELQNLIGYIKRKSGTIDPLDPYAEPKVSTEEPIDSMYHFGIPGMKWGRRKAGVKQSREDRKKAREEYKKEYKQFVKDSFRHPIRATGSQLKTLRNNPKEIAKAMNPFGGPSVNYYKTVNKDVARKVAEGKAKKVETKTAKESAKSADHKNKVALKSKKLSEMSNAELKSFNERLQLEKQYKDLTKSEVSPGRKFITDILVSAGKQTAINYTSKYMGKGVEALIKKYQGGQNSD